MLQICLWITSYEVKGLVAAKLSWVDPASFAAMESDTHLLYFTKLSGKSRDFYFLVGIHLNNITALVQIVAWCWPGADHYLSQWWLDYRRIYASLCLNELNLNRENFVQPHHQFNETIMTSSNGNIFRVTGPLWGESTCHRWIPLAKVSDAELWCFLWSAPGQTAEQAIGTPVIWDTIALIMTSL